MAADLDRVELETPEQLSDWVELEGGQRIRIGFIPQARWASILSRDTVLRKGSTAIAARLEAGTSDDPAADAKRLGDFQIQILQVAGEVVGLSLREIEGREPLRIEGGALAADCLEVLALDGLFWPVHAAIMRAHWTNADQARALFRCRLGQPV